MNTPKLIFSSDSGLTGQDQRNLVKLCNKGALQRIRHGSYVTSEDWNDLSPRAKYGLGAYAYRHRAGDEPIFCYATAALLWGLWIVGTPSLVHVRTSVTAGGCNRNGIRRHIATARDGLVHCGQLLITDKLTTTMDLINKLPFPYAVAVCDSSLRRPDPRHQINHFTDTVDDQAEAQWVAEYPQGPALTIEGLRTAAMQLPSQSARTRTLTVINFASALSGSAGESISRAKMHLYGFPAPELQKKFILRNGRNAFVDFWFKELNLAGEFDGKGKYLRADWGGGVSIQDRVMAEKAREDDIRSQGARFVRWTWSEMMNRERFTALLRNAGLVPNGK